MSDLLCAREKRLLKRMMLLYSKQRMRGQRDYNEEDDFDSIKAKLLPVKTEDIKCPGCDEVITVDNAGGYRTYCDICVDQMPPMPSETDSGSGYYIEGRFPNFEWIIILDA